MSEKICFFIETWQTKDFPNIKKMAHLNHPIIVSAAFLQKQENGDEFLELFRKNQIHILSEDVDLKISELTIALQACQKMQKTHLVVLNDFTGALVSHLENLHPLLSEHQNVALFSFIQKRSGEIKKYPLFEKIMNMDNIDYRSYWTKNNIYSLQHIESLGEKSHLSEFTILISLIKSNKKLMPLSIECSSDKRLKNRPKKRVKDYFYELYLIIYSALTGSISPVRAGLSFAMGIFVACTPFYGLQTLIILCFSFFFRLNFPVAYLASQISLPPFYAFLVPLHLYVGQLILNKPFFVSGNYLQIAQENFSSWLMGSLVVGFALSIVSGYIWYLIQSRFNKNKLQISKA